MCTNFGSKTSARHWASERGGARHETWGAANYEHTWHGGRGRWKKAEKEKACKLSAQARNWFFSPAAEKWWMEESSKVATYYYESLHNLLA